MKWRGNHHQQKKRNSFFYDDVMQVFFLINLLFLFFFSIIKGLLNHPSIRALNKSVKSAHTLTSGPGSLTYRKNATFIGPLGIS